MIVFDHFEGPLFTDVFYCLNDGMERPSVICDTMMAPFKLTWSMDVDLAQPPRDEIEERAHPHRQMSPARIEGLNCRFGRSVVRQQALEPLLLKISGNVQ